MLALPQNRTKQGRNGPESITAMSTEQEFRDKMRAKIDGCGPYCSFLVIILVLAFAFFMFLIR